MNADYAAAQNPLAGIMLRVGAATSFAFMAAMVKLGADYGVHPVELLFWRFSLALLPMTMIVALGPGLASLKTRRPFAHLWRAVIGFVGMGFGYWSITLLPLAEATAISFAAPIIATILSVLLLSEVVGWPRWIAILVGFSGVLMVMQPQSSVLPSEGLIVASIAALGVACVIITLRQINRTENALTTVFWFTAISAVALSALVPFYMRSHQFEAWLVVLAVALLGGTAQYLLTASLRVAAVAVIAPFDYTQLLWAIMLGWLLWSDMPAITTWIGSAIIIASGLFTLFRERRLARDARPVIA